MNAVKRKVDLISFQVSSSVSDLAEHQEPGSQSGAASGCVSFNLLKTGEILPGNQQEKDFAPGKLVRFHTFTRLTSPTGVSPSADPLVTLFTICLEEKATRRDAPSSLDLLISSFSAAACPN